MRSAILILFAILSFASCKKQTNKLNILFYRSDKTDLSPVYANLISIRNQDSIIYKVHLPTLFNYRDTLKLDSLSDGKYQLRYINILGNTVTKKFSLRKNMSKVIKIVCDSISTGGFITKIPFNSLQENKSYIVERKGGCVAAMFAYYKISRKHNRYYYESVNISKKLLNAEDITAIKKFEGELLAINGKGVCGGTGIMTYKIIKDKIETSIIDHACNWRGFEQMMDKVNRNEKQSRFNFK